MSAECMRVVIRPRPFSAWERAKRCASAIHIDEEKGLVTACEPSKEHPDYGTTFGGVRQKSLEFEFDRVYCPQTSQEEIFEDVGVQALDSWSQGYNTCILAYGQTGSGKTFTVLGTHEDAGLAPRICEVVFDSIAGGSGNNCNVVRFSFMEIYMEKVRDLLDEFCVDGGSPTSPSGRQSLRVREHPKHGPYVEDLSWHTITTYQQAMRLIDCGIQRRTEAATWCHDQSSRSHAILSVLLMRESGSDQLTSKLSLVDLAGCERTNNALSRQQLKQGASINKSLGTLGNVIHALSERRPNKRDTLRQPYIPYRDSVLTWLLKDSIGGNSKTVLIATISPAETSYRETLCTLRYARRAKLILNQPVINEDPNLKLIRELQAEISRLQTLLAQNQHLRLQIPFVHVSSYSSNFDVRKERRRSSSSTLPPACHRYAYQTRSMMTSPIAASDELDDLRAQIERLIDRTTSAQQEATKKLAEAVELIETQKLKLVEKMHDEGVEAFVVPASPLFDQSEAPDSLSAASKDSIGSQTDVSSSKISDLEAQLKRTRDVYEAQIRFAQNLIDLQRAKLLEMSAALVAPPGLASGLGTIRRDVIELEQKQEQFEEFVRSGTVHECSPDSLDELNMTQDSSLFSLSVREPEPHVLSRSHPEAELRKKDRSFGSEEKIPSFYAESLPPDKLAQSYASGLKRHREDDTEMAKYQKLSLGGSVHLSRSSWREQARPTFRFMRKNDGMQAVVQTAPIPIDNAPVVDPGLSHEPEDDSFDEFFDSKIPTQHRFSLASSAGVGGFRTLPNSLESSAFSVHPASVEAHIVERHLADSTRENEEDSLGASIDSLNASTLEQTRERSPNAQRAIRERAERRIQQSRRSSSSEEETSSEEIDLQSVWPTQIVFDDAVQPIPESLFDEPNEPLPAPALTSLAEEEETIIAQPPTNGPPHIVIDFPIDAHAHAPPAADSVSMATDGASAVSVIGATPSNDALSKSTPNVTHLMYESSDESGAEPTAPRYAASYSFSPGKLFENSAGKTHTVVIDSRRGESEERLDDDFADLLHMELREAIENDPNPPAAKVESKRESFNSQISRSDSIFLAESQRSVRPPDSDVETVDEEIVIATDTDDEVRLDPQSETGSIVSTSMQASPSRHAMLTGSGHYGSAMVVPPPLYEPLPVAAKSEPILEAKTEPIVEAKSREPVEADVRVFGHYDPLPTSAEEVTLEDLEDTDVASKSIGALSVSNAQKVPQPENDVHTFKNFDPWLAWIQVPPTDQATQKDPFSAFLANGEKSADATPLTNGSARSADESPESSVEWIQPVNLSGAKNFTDSRSAIQSGWPDPKADERRVVQGEENWENFFNGETANKAADIDEHPKVVHEENGSRKEISRLSSDDERVQALAADWDRRKMSGESAALAMTKQAEESLEKATPFTPMGVQFQSWAAEETDDLPPLKSSTQFQATNSLRRRPSELVSKSDFEPVDENKVFSFAEALANHSEWSAMERDEAEDVIGSTDANERQKSDWVSTQVNGNGEIDVPLGWSGTVYGGGKWNGSTRDDEEEEEEPEDDGDVGAFPDSERESGGKFAPVGVELDWPKTRPIEEIEAAFQPPFQSWTAQTPSTSQHLFDLNIEESTVALEDVAERKQSVPKITLRVATIESLPDDDDSISQRQVPPNANFAPPMQCSWTDSKPLPDEAIGEFENESDAVARWHQADVDDTRLNDFLAEIPRETATPSVWIAVSYAPSENPPEAPRPENEIFPKTVDEGFEPAQSTSWSQHQALPVAPADFNDALKVLVPAFAAEQEDLRELFFVKEPLDSAEIIAAVSSVAKEPEAKVAIEEDVDVIADIDRASLVSATHDEASSSMQNGRFSVEKVLSGDWNAAQEEEEPGHEEMLEEAQAPIVQEERVSDDEEMQEREEPHEEEVDDEIVIDASRFADVDEVIPPRAGFISVEGINMTFIPFVITNASTEVQLRSRSASDLASMSWPPAYKMANMAKDLTTSAPDLSPRVSSSFPANSSGFGSLEGGYDHDDGDDGFSHAFESGMQMTEDFDDYGQSFTTVEQAVEEAAAPMFVSNTYMFLRSPPAPPSTPSIPPRPTYLPMPSKVPSYNRERRVGDEERDSSDDDDDEERNGHQPRKSVSWSDLSGRTLEQGPSANNQDIAGLKPIIKNAPPARPPPTYQQAFVNLNDSVASRREPRLSQAIRKSMLERLEQLIDEVDASPEQLAQLQRLPVDTAVRRLFAKAIIGDDAEDVPPVHRKDVGVQVGGESTVKIFTPLRATKSAPVQIERPASMVPVQKRPVVASVPMPEQPQRKSMDPYDYLAILDSLLSLLRQREKIVETLGDDMDSDLANRINDALLLGSYGTRRPRGPVFAGVYSRLSETTQKYLHDYRRQLLLLKRELDTKIVELQRVMLESVPPLGLENPVAELLYGRRRDYLRLPPPPPTADFLYRLLEIRRTLVNTFRDQRPKNGRSAYQGSPRQLLDDVLTTRAMTRTEIEEAQAQLRRSEKLLAEAVSPRSDASSGESEEWELRVRDRLYGVKDPIQRMHIEQKIDDELVKLRNNYYLAMKAQT